MAFGPERSTSIRSGAAAADIDLGLRAYMLKIYNYMALGVALTGAVAFFIASNEQLTLLVAQSFWLIFLALLAFGWFIAPRVMTSGSTTAGQAMFWTYAALWGVFLGPTFYIHLQTDPLLLLRAFLITSATFGGLSLYGYTTKRDLSPIGSFLVMASIGILLALLVNIFFFQDDFFSLLVSGVAVLIFSAATAYETQAIKNFYMESDSLETANRKTILGAYMLYGSFIALFVFILRILSILRGN